MKLWDIFKQSSVIGGRMLTSLLLGSTLEVVAFCGVLVSDLELLPVGCCKLVSLGLCCFLGQGFWLSASLTSDRGAMI